ncbi:hypothetical protein BKA70DRAFT_1567989 [Coprinopsis sp. MPI-PUGE-AT-0042]|nr:hypothetical protein BKA70DRAFT_1567989 [Coprinopsis sp. MPI-PUGE-AT-0042]
MRKHYAVFLLLILVLSLLRFSLYMREGTPHLVDSPGIRSYGALRSPYEYAASFVFTAALSLVGDAFLVWRATVVWTDHCILKRIPIVIYLIHFGVCLISSVFKFRALKDAAGVEAIPVGKKDMLRHWGRFSVCQRAQIVYQVWRTIDFAMSVVVNAVTTTMIIARLVLMERKMRRLATQSATLRSALPYRQVIVLLLESALPFTLVGVASAITTVLMDAKVNTYTRAVHLFPIMMVLWTNALALGPQIIILRTISGNTWTSTPSSRRSQPISQPILFADDPVVSFVALSVDDDNEESRGQSQRDPQHFPCPQNTNAGDPTSQIQSQHQTLESF